MNSMLMPTNGHTSGGAGVNAGSTQQEDFPDHQQNNTTATTTTTTTAPGPAGMTSTTNATTSTAASAPTSTSATAVVQQGQSTDFVKKLFQMLEENRFSNIVRWTDSGDSFMISDTNEFTKEVLPCYFKHSNFSSFVRQLNKYDFHKVKLSQEIRQRYQLENVWEFKHPDFNRFDKSSLENIKRKVPAKKEQTETVSAANCVPITSYRKLEDRVNFLEKENVTLNTNINNMYASLNKLNQKYNTLVSNLLTSKDINVSFSRSIQLLSKGLTQLGVQLPPLDLPHLDYLGDTSGDNISSLNTHSNNATTNTHPVATHRTNGQVISNDLNNLGNFNNHGTATLHNINSNDSQLSDSHSGSNRRNSQTNHAAGNILDVKIKQEDEMAESELKPTPTNSALNPQARLLNRPQGSALHVLLVEDDDVCIQLCRKFLMKYGCTVVVVTDGLSAISAVEQVKFDLVLMDIVMPNLDGASATSVIRSFDKDTPIIAMTGNYQRNDLVTYLNHGMTDILAKPFTKDDLYMILEKHKMDRKLNFTNKSPDDDITQHHTQHPQHAPHAQPSLHQRQNIPSLTSQAPTAQVQIPTQQNSSQMPQGSVDNHTLMLASQANSAQSNPDSSNTPSGNLSINTTHTHVQNFDSGNSNNTSVNPPSVAPSNNNNNNGGNIIEGNGNTTNSTVNNTNQNNNTDATNNGGNNNNGTSNMNTANTATSSSNGVSNGNSNNTNNDGGNKMASLGDQLLSSNLPSLNERRITQARIAKKYGNNLLNSASSMSAGQMVQEMELNVASIPNVHDDLLTPTLLESTGLTPEAGIPSDVGETFSAAAAVAVSGVPTSTHQSALSIGQQQQHQQQQHQHQQNAAATASDALSAAEMDIAGVSDAEFGDMFKRRRIL